VPVGEGVPAGVGLLAASLVLIDLPLLGLLGDVNLTDLAADLGVDDPEGVGEGLGASEFVDEASFMAMFRDGWEDFDGDCVIGAFDSRGRLFRCARWISSNNSSRSSSLILGLERAAFQNSIWRPVLPDAGGLSRPCLPIALARLAGLLEPAETGFIIPSSSS